jgi:arylsulfatase A-like enzyme
MAEVYAGFLSHTDHEIGRLLDYLVQTGEYDNTIVVFCSDNGACGAGRPDGSVNVQHPHEAVEALQLRGRHRGPADRLLAERRQGPRRVAPPVLPRFAFEKDGDGMPTTGTLALYIHDENVGEGQIQTQPGKFALSGGASTSGATGPTS